MRYLCAVLLLAALAAPAVALDSSWVSYHRGFNYWFAYTGPQRAMKLHPADFNLTHPVRIESLKTNFYSGMGSLDDSVFTFRIYSGDGQTLLWESESLTLHIGSGTWFAHPVEPPVTIDTGDCYIATTHRLLDPWAHPYVRKDSGPSGHSFSGLPGAWELWDDGEFSFYAWMREAQSGQREGGWTEPAFAPERASLVGRRLVLAGERAAYLLDLGGRRVGLLRPGDNDVSGLRSGVYFVRPEGAGEVRPRKVIIP